MYYYVNKNKQSNGDNEVYTIYRGNIIMKLKIYRIFLYLFFSVAVGFSFQIEAFAHEYRGQDHSPELNISAENVDVRDEASIKKMTRHLEKHIALIQEDSTLSRPEQAKELVILAQRMREQGVFNNGEVYSVVVNPEGYIVNHGLYPDLHFKRYLPSFEFKDGNGMTTVTMQTLLDSDSEDPTCIGYHYDGEDRTVCAMVTEVFSAGGRTISVMGLHHAEDNYSLIEKDNPNCDVPLYKLPVTAKQVDDEQDPQEKEELLVQYVKAVAGKFKERQDGITSQLLLEAPNLVSLASGLVPSATPEQIQSAEEELGEKSVEIALRTTGCIGGGDYREGSIYPFMLEPEEGLAVLNGLDFHLYGVSVSLTDPDPIQCDGANILEAFNNAVTNGSGDLADLAVGNNGFVTYHWDHPEDPGDNNEGYLERNEVPGDSIKKSYIEVIDVTPPFAPSDTPPFWRIVGSGIYLDDAEYCKDGDEGCAISATANTPQSVLLNLFLIASVLFSAVFLRKHI